jgi:hypothetical protein
MLVFSWYVMVGSCNSFAGPEYRDTPLFQAIKRLRTGNLVDIMPVDVKYIGSIFNGTHYMGIPDFIEKCFSFQFSDFQIFRFSDSSIVFWL